MVTSLGEFDDKLTDLERLMKPIEDETHMLKNAHSNISRCAAYMENILQHFRTAAKAAPTLRGGSLRGASLPAAQVYVQQLDSVKTSLDYFSSGAPASFVSAPEAVRELSSLYEAGIVECQAEFTRILDAEATRSLDLRVASLAADDNSTKTTRTSATREWPALQGLTVFDHRAVAILQQLCPRLHAADRGRAYLDEYAASRSGWVLDTLVTSSDGGLEPLALALAAKRYQKSTHPFIHYGCVSLCVISIHAAFYTRDSLRKHVCV